MIFEDELISQCDPVHPSGQTHSYELMWSMQSPLTHGFEAHSSISTSHSVPVYPGLHVHTNPFTLSTHSPCTQGFEAHSSISGKKITLLRHASLTSCVCAQRTDVTDVTSPPRFALAFVAVDLVLTLAVDARIRSTLVDV